MNARGVPGARAELWEAVTFLPPGQVSRLGPGAHWGLALTSGSVSFLVWPLTVRIQGNKTFRKQTAWTRTRSAGSWFLAGWVLRPHLLLRSVLMTPVASLTRSLRRLLCLLGTFLLRELLAGGDGVLLGPPLRLGWGLQATSLQHLAGTPAPVSGDWEMGTHSPCAWKGLKGLPNKPSEARLALRKWRPFELGWRKVTRGWPRGIRLLGSRRVQ